MPIRLNLSNDPVTVEVAEGVTITLEPLRSSVFAVANTRVRDWMPYDPAEEDDEDVMIASNARRHARRVAEVVAAGIVEWDGFVGDDDKPVPPSRENVLAVMEMPQVFSAIEARYYFPGLTVIDEGNVSRPSSTGSSAAA